MPPRPLRSRTCQDPRQGRGGAYDARTGRVAPGYDASRQLSNSLANESRGSNSTRGISASRILKIAYVSAAERR
jgi:hypothetical protein